MTPLKKPFKIKVIDEDEIANPVKKTLNKEEKTEKKKTTKKPVSKKKKTAKKSITVKKTAVKKEAKKPTAKKKEKTEIKAVEVEEEIDSVEVAVGKISAVKNLIMSSGNKNDEIDSLENEKDVKKDTENDEEQLAESDKKETEDSKEVSDEDVEEDEVKEEEVVENPYDMKGHSVKDVIASSMDAEQEKQEEKVGEDTVHTKRSIAMYRKIAVSFIVFTIALVAVISYFSFIRVTIVLIPNQERVNNNIIFDVYDNDIDTEKGGSTISGIVEKVRTEVNEKFEATGETILGQEAVGKVVIHNNHAKNQPLVATTRLLPASDPNKLFRISNTVNVPAGGSIEVDMYADEPGPDMTIEPTKFTIPGLWAGLQDKIYAESSEAVQYRQKVKKHVIQDDIDNSERYLKQKLINNVKSEIDSSYGEYGKVIYKTDENSIDSTFDINVNDEVDEFDIGMSANVVVVAFDSESAADFAEQKFASSLSENKEMLSFDRENIIYSLNNYSTSEKTATINATFEGRVSLKDDSSIVDKKKIVGLNKQQLDAYLRELPDIAGFEVKFYPPFINKIPKLIELSKIKIEVKK